MRYANNVKAIYELPKIRPETNPGPKTTKMLLSITEEALEKVRTIAEAEKKPVPIILIRLIDEAASARANKQ